MTSFLTELRRRNVLKVAAAYAVASWILIEAGSVLLPTFGAPEWFFKGYVLVIAAGFLLALIFAWVLEWTPEGVKLEQDVDSAVSVRQPSGNKMTYTIIGLLVVALTISITLNITGLRQSGTAAGLARTGASIAVLPFDNRSIDPENALFADGIHDDLLTGLANIGSLKVISRTSVLKYRNPTRNLKEIATELGVDTVLEGSVQKAGNNVRINVQLIDARTDEHIWADKYDRELTARNIFQIQSEISEKIAAALRKQLTPEEQGRMAAIPTENLEAYSLYVAGRSNVARRQIETLQQARQQFQDAIELDPDYSLAYSGLADSILLLTINHNFIAWPEALQLATVALDKALALDDQNADAYASLGLLKMTEAQRNQTTEGFAEAEAAFRKAIALSPNHAQAYSWFASLKAAQLDLDEAARLYEKALELDPVARITRSNLAGIYAQMGRNDEALLQWLEAVRINPEWPNTYDDVARQLAALGRLDEAYAWSVKARELNADPLAGQGMIGVLLQFGEGKRALEVVSGIPAEHPLYPVLDGVGKLFDGDYAATIDSWESAIDGGFTEAVPFIIDVLSDAALLIGDSDKSLRYALRRVPNLEDPDFTVDSGNVRNAIKYAYMLMQKDPGSQHAARLLADALTVTETLPRLGLGGHGINDVEILALQGRPAEALTRFRQAYDEGFRGSRIYENWYLSENPYLETIRDTDEFRAVKSDIDAAVDVMRRRVDAARQSGDFEPILASTRRSVRR